MRVSSIRPGMFILRSPRYQCVHWPVAARASAVLLVSSAAAASSIKRLFTAKSFTAFAPTNASTYRSNPINISAWTMTLVSNKGRAFLDSLGSVTFASRIRPVNGSICRLSAMRTGGSVGSARTSCGKARAAQLRVSSGLAEAGRGHCRVGSQTSAHGPSF